MTTFYDNQSIAFTDNSGNTVSLIPGTGLVIQTPTQTLTTSVNGFDNGTQTLLFTDLYVGVEKTRSVKFDISSNTTKLSVVNTIEIQDDDTIPTQTNTITGDALIFSKTSSANNITLNNSPDLINDYYPYLRLFSEDPTYKYRSNLTSEGHTQTLRDFTTNNLLQQIDVNPTGITLSNVTTNDTTEITPTSVSVSDSGGVAVSNLTKQSLTFSTTTGPSALYELGGVLIDDATGNTSNLGVGDLVISNSVAGDYTLLNNTTLNMVTSTTTSFYNSTTLSFTNGVTTNTLNASDWTGNIRTVNTVANLTHYLNFSDSSATGYGHPQKTAGISCNPSTNTITATIFNGLASSSTSSVGVDLTSDDTSGSYYLPFSKTIAATGNALFIDNTTTPLTYNPLSSTLTASIFSGSATTASITDTNINTTYYPVFVSAAGTAQTLRCDIATGPLAYNPSTGNMSILGNFTAASITVDNILAGTGTSSITSFTAGVLSLVMGNITFRNFGWVVTGATNTMSGLTLTTTRINGVYKVCILNNGTGNLTINTGLSGGTYYLKYTAAVVVPAGSLAVINITILNVNSITRVIVDAYNVT